MNRAIPAVLLSSQPVDRRARALRDLRISVIETCNFRCPYCMPADRFPDLPAPRQSQRLAVDEIVLLARVFVDLGVRKLRLTGGEPLLRRDLDDIVAGLAAIDGVEDLAMTSNGSLLASRAAALRAAGLQRLTLSLDSLDEQRFRQLSGGRGELAQVLAGLAAAEQAGFDAIKINCVIQRGVNEQDVLPLVERFRGTPHVLRFIEYMDVGTCNGWRPEHTVPSAELVARIGARWPLQALDAGYRGEVAQRYAFVDGAGEIGFVSSVSRPFCGDCQRARLSSEGELFTCLFAAHGMDLRGPLRDGASAAELAALVATRWQQRDDRYSELRAQLSGRSEHVEMYRIGG